MTGNRRLNVVNAIVVLIMGCGSPPGALTSS